MIAEDSNAVLDSISVAFHEGEAISAAGGVTLEDHHKINELFVRRMAGNGNCIVAVEMEDPTVVLGAFLNEDFANPPPEGLEETLASLEGNMTPVMSTVEELEGHLRQKYGLKDDLERGKVLHLWMLGVTTEARGRKIGQKLAIHSIAWAKKQGFKIAFAEATGAASTHILTKHGGQEVVHFIDYGVYEGPCQEQVRALPGQGHNGASLTVSDFRQKKKKT